jgi:hypothetical protein
MKNVCYLLGMVLVLTSCNQTNEKLKERISHSDSVAIKFYKGDGTIDSVVAVKIFRDSKTVNQLVNLIAERNSSEKFKCGYDGSIHFFKMNSVVQDIDFKMNDANCMYFSFLQEGKMQITLLSLKAKQLLESLQK